MNGIRISSRTFIRFHGSGFYFRIFNKGLSVNFSRRVLFSERIGARKVWRIGRLAVEVLR